VGFTEAVFLSGTDLPYPLKEDRFLPLSHSLFDDDAVILKNMPSVMGLDQESARKVLTELGFENLRFTEERLVLNKAKLKYPFG